MTMRRTTCPQCRKRLADGERIHKECVSAWADTRAAKAERAQAKVIKAAAKEEHFNSISWSRTMSPQRGTLP